MEERGVRRLLWIHEEWNGRLGGLTRQLAGLEPRLDKELRRHMDPVLEHRPAETREAFEKVASPLSRLINNDPYVWDGGHLLVVFSRAREALARLVELAEGRQHL